MRGLVRISLCVAKSQGIQLRFNAACACGRTVRPPSHAFPSPGHRRLFHFSSRINDFGIILIRIPADHDKDSVIAAPLGARSSCSTSMTSTARIWREWRHVGSFLLSNCADGASTTRSVFAADQWCDRDGDGDDRGVVAATGLIHARDGLHRTTDRLHLFFMGLHRTPTDRPRGMAGWRSPSRPFDACDDSRPGAESRSTALQATPDSARIAASSAAIRASMVSRLRIGRAGGTTRVLCSFNSASIRPESGIRSILGTLIGRVAAS